MYDGVNFKIFLVALNVILDFLSVSLALLIPKLYDSRNRHFNVFIYYRELHIYQNEFWNFKNTLCHFIYNYTIILLNLYFVDESEISLKN